MATTYTDNFSMPIMDMDDPHDQTLVNDAIRIADREIAVAQRGKAAYNLLDNSNFLDPANQRGQTNYTGSGYTIDRWRIYSAATVSVTAAGLVVDATSVAASLYQIIETLPNGTFTFAAKVNGEVVFRVIANANGTITTSDNSKAAFDGGYIAAGKDSSGYFVQISNSVGYTNTIEWAALYEGEYTEETLPDYVPKGYAAEMAECQRYFQQVKLANGYLTTYAFSSTSARTVLFIPRMRISSPSITTDNTLTLLEGSTRYEVTGMSLTYVGSNNYNLTLTTSGLTGGKIYPIYPKDGNFPATLSISADL